MTIWKYKIPLRRTTEIEMPEGAAILHVAHQIGNAGCMWVLVDPERPTRLRRFCICGTGQALGSMEEIRGWQHVGTYQLDPYVWHVFEIPPEADER